MNTTTFTAAKPSRMRITKRNPDGSGVVEIPVLKSATIDLARTAGGGTGKVTITPAELSQIEENFTRWPGPVPVHVYPHRPQEEMAGAVPGFVESLAAKGDELWATVFLTAPLFAQVEGGFWRGFSVDLAKDKKHATCSIDGWAMWAGVFTNQPAADVNFAPETIAASAVVNVLTALSERERGGNDMSEQNVSLEAQLALAESRKSTLEAQLTAVRQQVSDSSLAAKAAEEARQKVVVELATVSDERDRLNANLELTRKQNEQLTAELSAAKAKLEKTEAETIAQKVTKVVRLAISRGISPAAFDGHENDPAGWLRQNFASIEALERFAGSLQPMPKSDAVPSGRESDDAPSLSAQSAAVLRSHGLDPKYATVRTSDDLKHLTK